VLVRFPLHVILSVEAAFPSTIVPETSEKMQTNVRRFNIATTAKRSLGFVYFSGMGAVATMGLVAYSDTKNRSQRPGNLSNELSTDRRLTTP
jgi:hypothetical protein